MDLHVLIVIACVFLVSLFSLLFISKFFRGKTFEEVAAEKKLLAERLYGTKSKRQNRPKVLNKKTPKERKPKIQPAITEQDSQNNDSDGQSESPSIESGSSPSHKKQHVEFEPDVIEIDLSKRSPVTLPVPVRHGKQRKNNGKNSGSGILVNKSEPIIVKETATVEQLNSFDIKPPKDALEIKRASRDDTAEGTKLLKFNAKQEGNKKLKGQKKIEDVVVNVPSVQTEPAVTVNNKEIKQLDEKLIKSNDSPKNQNNKNQKKKNPEISFLEKFSSPYVIGVNTLIAVLSRAELNRNEIQILIDYLLNKQQDTTANHSEWSDDIVQKLRKQLQDKEKALHEEQESSVGIQAKLRELRTEINSERAQFNANIKAYLEDIHGKKSEIHNLNQEILNITEKFQLERQQYQTKLRNEKQNNSQEFLNQISQLNESINILQNEIVQKNSIISEFQMITSAARQAEEDSNQKLNEIVQQKNNQIINLEKNLKDAEKNLLSQQYELELGKIAEKDRENSKVDIRNLQNALDSTRSELNETRNNNAESGQLNEVLNGQIDELKSQLTLIKSAYLEQQQQTNELTSMVDNYKQSIVEKELALSDCKNKIQTFDGRIGELLEQITEQKEKNNELRTKNWKLIEALNKAEASTRTNSKNLNNLVSEFAQNVATTQKVHSDETVKTKEEEIRKLFERLFPEATTASAGQALSLSFDQWIEQVALNVKKQNDKNVALNNSNILNSENRNSHTTASATQNNHNNNNSNHNDSDSVVSNNSTTIVGELGVAAVCAASEYDDKPLKLENAKLRAQVEELKSLVTKLENVLTNLETKALEQESHWRNVVQSKDEEIYTLRNSNGQAI